MTATLTSNPALLLSSPGGISVTVRNDIFNVLGVTVVILAERRHPRLVITSARLPPTCETLALKKSPTPSRLFLRSRLIRSVGLVVSAAKTDR